jgi:hypothetical protein
VSKKSNVHPDYYKTDGRDRPDDAARARLNRAIAAKAPTQQRPDRTGKDLYFERPDPTRQPGFEAPAPRPKAKKSATRAGAAGNRAPRKAARPKRAAAGTSRKPARARKPAAPRRSATGRKTGAVQAKKSGKSAARPAKKR